MRSKSMRVINVVIAVAMYGFALLVGIAAQDVCTLAFFSVPATAHLLFNVILLSSMRIWVDDTHLHCQRGPSLWRRSFPLHEVAHAEATEVPAFVFAWRGWPARRLSDGLLLFRVGTERAGVIVQLTTGTRAFFQTDDPHGLVATLARARGRY
ncbi:MAG: hypothetical protein R3B82_21895 [Sandaracinaceae bacterium]